MPRISRIIIPGCPHHIIQRGNRRQQVFFSDSDKALYMDLLKRQIDKHGFSVWAYCLMGNHIHLIAVPAQKNSFAKGFAEAHRKYTSLINIREDWKGYLWQGRFISYPLDEAHCYAAIRYVERNPVRAGLVAKAEDYPWSSARAHVYRSPDPLISRIPLEAAICDWASYLGQEDTEGNVREFIEHESTGRPLGSDDFIRRLEQSLGRTLAPKKRGRKKSEMSIVSPN
jgi:putative transposase